MTSLSDSQSSKFLSLQRFSTSVHRKSPASRQQRTAWIMRQIFTPLVTRTAFFLFKCTSRHRSAFHSTTITCRHLTIRTWPSRWTWSLIKAFLSRTCWLRNITIWRLGRCWRTIWHREFQWWRLRKIQKRTPKRRKTKSPVQKRFQPRPSAT